MSYTADCYKEPEMTANEVRDYQALIERIDPNSNVRTRLSAAVWVIDVMPSWPGGIPIETLHTPGDVLRFLVRAARFSRRES